MLFALNKHAALFFHLKRNWQVNTNTFNFYVKVSVTADPRKCCAFYRSVFPISQFVVKLTCGFASSVYPLISSVGFLSVGLYEQVC